MSGPLADPQNKRWRYTRRQTRAPESAERFAMNVPIDLTEEQFEKMQETARALGVGVEELTRAAIADLLAQPMDDFQQAADYVLKKNRALYERLR